ncbi:MAG: bifunctional histidinol-phosphatase/imidazoleglycerol-phosphate dehydratase HisB [Bacteroidales bacterium]
MKKLLIIDRDGTLIKEPADYQIDSFEKLELLPGVLRWLGQIVREMDYELVMATNQDGLGTDSFPEETFWGPHNHLLKILEGEGIVFNDILIDPSFEEGNSPNRKPRTGMFEKYANGDYDFTNSFVIGDRLTDVELAKNLGAKSILIGGKSPKANHNVTCWEEIYQIVKPKRVATVARKTNETDIAITVDLDGALDGKLNTGLGFLDHMLEQIDRHAGIGISAKCVGDLHVDEHHTVEDIAIALGDAIKQALGNKVGIGRYGFALPMDDCQAKVLLDLGGRPYFKWKATFKREKIGDMATELLPHFFQSLSYSLSANLHVKAKGHNEHHKAEGIFKAFARALKQAVRFDGNELPSTKGRL